MHDDNNNNTADIIIAALFLPNRQKMESGKGRVMYT
jgi:hypothetical protein